MEILYGPLPVPKVGSLAYLFGESSHVSIGRRHGRTGRPTGDDGRPPGDGSDDSRAFPRRPGERAATGVSR
jgi:hypothetical protein